MIEDSIVHVLVDDTVNILSFNVILLPFTGGDSGDSFVSSLLVLLTSSFATFCLRFNISVIPSEALIKDNIVHVLVDDTVNILSFSVIAGGDSRDSFVSSLLVLLTSSFATFCLRFNISVIPSEALIKDNIAHVLVDDTVNILSFSVIAGGDSGDSCVSSLLVLFTSRFSTFCLHFKISVMALLKLGLKIM